MDTYQELLESHFDAIWQLDRDMRLTSFNSGFSHRFLTLYGVKLAIGSVPTAHLPESERTRWQEWYSRVLEGQAFTVEERYQTPDGELFLAFLLSPQRDPDGTVSGIYGIGRDVTNSRVREMASVRLVGRLNAVFESAVQMNTAIREPEVVFRETMDLIAAAVSCTSGTVQLIDGGDLKVVQAHGFAPDSGIFSLRFPLTAYFPNYEVVQTQQTIAIADIRREYPHFLQEDGQYMSGHVRSWMGVPLIDSGEVVGMFTLDRDQVDPFSPEDIQIVTALAHHAAIAIRNTRVYSDQNLLLRELHHRVKNTTQLILSLITLQTSSVGTETKNVLDELALRIRTLSAVHESMYVADQLDQVDLDRCVRHVVRELELRFSDSALESPVHFISELSPKTRVSLERAVPFGLLVNEVLLSLVRRASGSSVITVALNHDETSVTMDFSVRCERGCLDPDESLAGVMSKNLREGLLAQIKGTLKEEPPSPNRDQLHLVLRTPR